MDDSLIMEIWDTFKEYIPEKNKDYTAQIRYHGELLNCKLVCTGQTCAISFDKSVLVDKGQSIVFYNNDICLGGCVVG